MAEQALNTTCCVVGGGPAGVMLGYLLARSGVRVTVLEKHGDFLRDFRGDTVHPSTLQVLHELGLLEAFLQVPHQKVYEGGGVFGDFAFGGPDFRGVPGEAKYIALMPQWDFLDFLSDRAKRFPSFDLRMRHEATELIRDGDRVTGVVVRGPDGTTLRVRADLVVACDGRHSAMRKAAGLEVVESGVPIDVLWFRISRHPTDPEQILGRVNFGKALVMLNRGNYFQCGLIIRKGSFEELKSRGLDNFRESVRQLAPFLENRVGELQEWDHVKLLTVQINRLQRWFRTGLLCIGDAAHAMSPAGGVGINLAIQDAVATANLLHIPLREASASDADLEAVQSRREFPARVTQAVQVRIHNGLASVFDHPGEALVPWQMKVVVKLPGFRRALGYAIGIGVRPEHVQETSSGSIPALTRFAATLGRAIGSLVVWAR